jgi:excisionase family DNA binding protein
MMPRVPRPPLSIHEPQNWPDVLSTAQVAALLAVNRQTILSLLDRGVLPGVRVGKPWRIAPEDVWPFVPPGIRARWPEGPWHHQQPSGGAHGPPR